MMKNILTALTFMTLIAAGIFLDSLVVKLICDIIGVHGGWLIFTQVVAWVVLATFTGGIVTVLAFVLAGAIYTSNNPK